MITEDQYRRIQEAVLNHSDSSVRGVLAQGTAKYPESFAGQTTSRIIMKIPPVRGSIQFEGLMESLRSLGSANGPIFFIDPDRTYLEIAGRVDSDIYILEIFVDHNNELPNLANQTSPAAQQQQVRGLSSEGS